MKFLCPGTVRDHTHELSCSNCFGEFCHWFRMPLSKVEQLMDILVYTGAIFVPRLLKFQEEFRERSELLVLSVLFRLGTGNSFCTCRALCNISVAEIRKFFMRFLDAMVDMKENYVYLLRNISGRHQNFMNVQACQAIVGQWTLSI
jgi:hypothetical protein